VARIGLFPAVLVLSMPARADDLATSPTGHYFGAEIPSATSGSV
jgi:hypothetical protein